MSKVKLVRVKADLPLSKYGGAVLIPDRDPIHEITSAWYRPGDELFVVESMLGDDTQWSALCYTDTTMSDYDRESVGALLKEHCTVLRGPLAWLKYHKLKGKCRVDSILKSYVLAAETRKARFAKVLAKTTSDLESQKAFWDQYEKT